MAVGNRDVVGFDASEALHAAQGVEGADVLLCVAYDSEGFEMLHADDRVAALYEDEDAMEAHFGEIHSYVHLDFTERELFEDMFIEADGVSAFVTYMGSFTAVRVIDEDEGMFLGLPPSAPVSEVVTAVQAAIA